MNGRKDRLRAAAYAREMRAPTFVSEEEGFDLASDGSGQVVYTSPPSSWEGPTLGALLGIEAVEDSRDPFCYGDGGAVPCVSIEELTECGGFSEVFVPRGTKGRSQRSALPRKGTAYASVGGWSRSPFGEETVRDLFGSADA